MSLTSNLPKYYKQVLLRERHATQFTYGHLSPWSRLAGNPLAPFLTVPQLPYADNDLGSAQEPAPGVGLQAPMILAAPRPSHVLGRAADLSVTTVNSYFLTCQYLASPPDLTSF
jgi:hypothetical protein